MNKHVIVISPLGYTGLAYYDFSLAESLHSLGNDVTLITSRGWKPVSRIKTFNALFMYHDPSIQKNNITKGLLYMVSTFRIIRYLARYANSKSLVQFEMSELPGVDLLIFLFCCFRKIKIYFTPHEIIHNKRYLGNMFFLKQMYRMANSIIVLNKNNIDELVSKFSVPPDKIIVIPHGNYDYFVESINKGKAREKLRLKQDDKIILFFGSIRPDKGLDVALDAMQIVRKQYPNIKLLIAGKPYGNLSVQSIESMISSRNLEDQVFFHGYFVNDGDVDCYFGASDVVLLAYRRVFESGVINLAFTYGKAVICSDLQEFKESIQDNVNGMFFSKNNPSSLAQRIYECFTGCQYEKLGYNARKISLETGSWSMIATLYAEAYNQ